LPSMCKTLDLILSTAKKRKKERKENTGMHARTHARTHACTHTHTHTEYYSAIKTNKIVSFAGKWKERSECEIFRCHKLYLE
jgi:hypothetical protein